MEDFEDGEGLGCEEGGEGFMVDFGEGGRGEEAGCVEETGGPAEEVEGVVGEEVGFC